MQTVASASDQADGQASQSELAEAPPTAADATSVAPASQVEAIPEVRAARDSDSSVQSTALELRAGTPALVPGDRLLATISFYYCRAGGMHTTAALGDGGNFCGIMRDGSIVYSGAAACDNVYLGQRFRIIGDPTGRVYKCADTGSAVHGVHRDIWFMVNDEGWVWQRSIGNVATLEILP